MIKVLSVAVLLAGCTATQAPRPAADPWQAYALMQTLNEQLLASRSATATLREWCAEHHLAATPEIVAEQLPGNVPASSEQRERLRVSADEPVRYRYVRLKCGDRVMSEAENWYVPSRLTADMNHQLDASRTPFGRAIESLQPYRKTFLTRVLRAEPDRKRPRSASPAALFEHRAIVYGASHQPLAEVRETYLPSALP